jgi:hypothetical protein
MAIRSPKSKKNRQYNGQKKKDKTTMVHKTVQGKLKIEQYESY